MFTKGALALTEIERWPVARGLLLCERVTISLRNRKTAAYSTAEKTSETTASPAFYLTCSTYERTAETTTYSSSETTAYSTSETTAETTTSQSPRHLPAQPPIRPARRPPTRPPRRLLGRHRTRQCSSARVGVRDASEHGVSFDDTSLGVRVLGGTVAVLGCSQLSRNPAGILMGECGGWSGICT